MHALPWRDTTFMAASLSTSILSCFLFWSTKGDLAVATVPLAMFGFAALAPTLARLDDISLVATWLAVILLLDAPAGYPFWDYDPLTETLGTLVFESASKFLGLTGLRLTLVEAGSYALALWLAFVNNRHEVLNLRFSGQFRFAAVMALLVPGTLLAFGAIGIIKGNDVALAMTQLRFVPLLACWTYIGYLACRRPQDTAVIFKVVVAAMVFKSLQGWFAYFFVFGADMGHREYLLEHLTSDQLATAMFVVLGAWYLFGARRVPTPAVVAAVVLMGFAYLLNDRRASFVGVAMCFILLPVVYFRDLTRRHWLALGAIVVLTVGFIAATWGAQGSIGIPARAVESLMSDAAQGSAASYRELEDFNLYSAVMSHPIAGLGFGKRFEIIAPLPDISMVYENFDAIPHNNVLFTWVFAGPAGIAALGTFIAVAIAIMMRLGRDARDRYLQLFAFVGFTMVVRWSFYVYADIGLMENRTLALIGLAVGMAMALQAMTPARRPEATA